VTSHVSTLRKEDLPLAQFRDFLLLLARTHLAREEPIRLDPSDLVQETLLEAHEKREQFRGSTPEELAAWLRQILKHNLVDALRARARAKRDIARERSLEAAVES